jgi:hypothetical protein
MSEDLRQVHLRGATGVVRTEMLNNREHIVVPVIALMDTVIHAVNASTPERVPLATLQKAAASWNGRPVVLGHPTRNGRQISANEPGVLAAYGLGTIFNSRVENGRLQMEAWHDVENTTRVAGQAYVDSIRAAKPHEVSVGAFVVTDGKAGTHPNGREYKASWVDTMGDHLAMLPNGRGACSIEMGCGAHRSAMHLVTAEGLEFEDGEESLETLGGKGSGWFSENGHVPEGGKNQKAINAINKTFGKDEYGDPGRSLVKFPQGSSEEAEAHYEAIKNHLVSSGFQKVRETPSYKSDPETVFKHNTHGALHLSHTYYGVIPGDAAKGYRGVHKVLLKRGEGRYTEERALGGPGSGWTSENGHVPGASAQGLSKKAHQASEKAHQTGKSEDHVAAYHAHTAAAKGHELDPDKTQTVPSAQIAHEVQAKEHLIASGKSNASGSGLNDPGGNTHQVGDGVISRGNDKSNPGEHGKVVSRHVDNEHVFVKFKGRNKSEKMHHTELVSQNRKDSVDIHSKRYHDTYPPSRVNPRGLESMEDKKTLRQRVMDLIRGAADGPAEEAAELVQYNTIKSLLQQCGDSYDEAMTIVKELITAEDEGTLGYSEEAAEEEIEAARLESVNAHCLQMMGSLTGIMNVTRALLADDKDPSYQRYMEAADGVRALVGKRHSTGDQAMLQAVHDHSVSLGAECSANRELEAAPELETPELEKEEKTEIEAENELKAAANHGCSCGGNGAAHTGEVDMTKVERIKALVATPGYSEADAKWLEAVPDERLTALEGSAKEASDLKAAADKTAADLKAAQEAATTAAAANTALEARLKAAEANMIPAEELTRLRAMAAAKQAEDNTKHASLVEQLKTAQTVLTEEQLKAATLTDLEMYAALAKVGTPVDQTARILPRAASKNQTYEAPDPYAAGIKALQVN